MAVDKTPWITYLAISLVAALILYSLYLSFAACDNETVVAVTRPQRTQKTPPRPVRSAAAVMAGAPKTEGVQEKGVTVNEPAKKFDTIQMQKTAGRQTYAKRMIDEADLPAPTLVTTDPRHDAPVKPTGYTAIAVNQQGGGYTGFATEATEEEEYDVRVSEMLAKRQSSEMVASSSDHAKAAMSLAQQNYNDSVRYGRDPYVEFSHETY